MKYLVINNSKSLDNAINSHPFAFVRFKSDRCHHCNSMTPEMEKLENHKLIDNLNVLVADADNSVIEDLNHNVSQKQLGQGVPSMYFIVDNVIDEYTGDREADPMAMYIKEMCHKHRRHRKKIGRNNKMKGGRKNKKGGGEDFQQLVEGPENKVPAPDIAAPDIAAQKEAVPDIAAPEAPATSAPAAPELVTSDESPMIEGNIYEDGFYYEGAEKKPCKDPCGDHMMGHGIASAIGLGNFTHAKCVGDDDKKHNCSKSGTNEGPAIGGRKRRTHRKKHKKSKKPKRKSMKKKKQNKRKTRKHKKGKKGKRTKTMHKKPKTRKHRKR